MSNLEYKSIEDAYNKGIAYCKEIAEDDSDDSYDEREKLSSSEKKRMMLTAIRYFDIAANQRHALAQYNLGLIYNGEYEGCGVKIDKFKAANYFRFAAEEGVADAQFEYSQSLLHGDGVEKNSDEHMHWLAKSAENGSPKGMLYYAEQLIGELIGDSGYDQKASSEYNLAIYYLRKAASCNGFLFQGKAQALMGVAYVEGWGVNPNNHSAIAFFSKALKDDGCFLWKHVIFYVYKYLTTGSFPAADKLDEYKDYYDVVSNMRLRDKLVEELQRQGI